MVISSVLKATYRNFMMKNEQQFLSYLTFQIPLKNYGFFFTVLKVLVSLTFPFLENNFIYHFTELFIYICYLLYSN